MRAVLAEDPKPDRIAAGEAILAQLDGKLTGAQLQLQVAADGRVTSFDLEGVPKDDDRQQHVHETMRQVLNRISAGFDMTAPVDPHRDVRWIEERSRLMSMPLPSDQTATQSHSTVIHTSSHYQGQVMVQSIGEGLIGVPAIFAEQRRLFVPTPAGAARGMPTGDAAGKRLDPDAWIELIRQNPRLETHYDTRLLGVSIYDADQGFMTERVFAVQGVPTAGALFDPGGYWHAGRIRILASDEQPPLGSTGIIAPPGRPIAGLPDWVAIESPGDR